MNIKKYIYLILPLVCWGCASDIEEVQEQQTITIDGSAFETDIEPFIYVDEAGTPLPQTRVNIEGDSFETGDLMRLRVIAPFVTSSEYGESTWGASYDNWRLYSWAGNYVNWGSVGSGRKFDVDNDYEPSGAPSTITMPQATPFVFTATTWSEEIHHTISSPGVPGGTTIISFSNVFKADQRKVENYKSSNVLWAQQYMQTGTDHVRLSFKHKMAALKVDIRAFDDSLNTTDEVILTLEQMPDIDQQEVTIGNYYAEKMKGTHLPYGDYYRTKCSYEENGKVLGIVVPDETEGHLVQLPIATLPQTGVYTALKGNSTIEGTQEGYFYLIIPPYTVPSDIKPTLWLRNGSKRWSAELSLPAGRTFQSGYLYKVEMKVPTVDNGSSGDSSQS